MSKRTRGSSRAQHRRPGARPASSRSAARQRDAASARPAPAVPSPYVNEPREEEPVTEAAARPVEDRERYAPRAANPRQRIKPGSLLASRAATEYLYVAQDLKRIGVVGGLLFGSLFALWLLIVILRVIPLPFY